MAKPDPADRLGHMLEAITQIETQIAGLDQSSFSKDRFRQLGIERCLEIVSEASRHIPDAAKAGHPEIPWRRIADIGNRIRHSYHAVDSGLIWDIVSGELAELKTTVVTMRQETA